MPTVVKGFYGDVLDVATNEHLKPHSQGGLTTLSNIVLASPRTNNMRGNKPLSMFYNNKHAQEYYKQFEGLVIPFIKRNKVHYFYGDDYKKLIQENVKSILKEEGRLDLLG